MPSGQAGTAHRAHLQHMAGALAEHALQHGTVLLQQIVWHKGLNGTGKAAAVHAISATITQHLTANGQRQAQPLIRGARSLTLVCSSGSAAKKSS